jgi:hypothetical protein
MIAKLHVPVTKPEDVIDHLAKKEKDWRPDHSAQELAESWFESRADFPVTVRQVLATAPEYSQAELVDAFFEREVELDSLGRNSQTDLMVIAGLGNELGVIAVEGKVEESFAEPVAKWNTSAGKQNRLVGLCSALGIDHTQLQQIRYQLLHRTVSAILEAKRYRTRHALMLVHSFSSSHRWFDDFSAFSRVMGIPLDAPGKCSAVKECDGVSLRLAWVADKIRSQRPALL